MPIWSRYRYRVEDYWPLILVLRQSNKYTHGVLVPLTSQQRNDPNRKRSKRERAANESRWLTSIELEDRALDNHMRDLMLADKSEEELADWHRQNFQFHPDPSSPDVLAHQVQGPKQVKGMECPPETGR